MLVKVLLQQYLQSTFSFFSSGSGDIDTSTVVKVDSEGCLGGASGLCLKALTCIVLLSMKINLIIIFSNVHINKSVDSNEINIILNYYALKRLLFLYVPHTHILCFYPKFVIGASLVVNSSWKNPSGEWHVGYKVVYELCTDTLTSGLKV